MPWTILPIPEPPKEFKIPEGFTLKWLGRRTLVDQDNREFKALIIEVNKPHGDKTAAYSVEIDWGLLQLSKDEDNAMHYIQWELDCAFKAINTFIEENA